MIIHQDVGTKTEKKAADSKKNDPPNVSKIDDNKEAGSSQNVMPPEESYPPARHLLQIALAAVSYTHLTLPTTPYV